MNHPQRKTPIHCPVIQRHNCSAIVFLTVCSARRKPILAGQVAHELVVQAWTDARAWLVGRYILLPDHLHLFCAPNVLDPVPLSQWVAFWKSAVARHWPVRAQQPIWQKSYWDTQLRHHTTYDAKWEYVRQNPVRHGLVPQANLWPYQGELNILEWYD